MLSIPSLLTARSKNLNKNESEISIYTNEVTISGALVEPAEKKSEALVIMISGSGPQDRDETLEGFGVFGVIADHLSSEGIASCRYDDRGVGGSTGDFVNSTIDDLTEDVEGIMDYYLSNGYKEFILLGHSQGGIIAGKVAAQNDIVTGVILMASTGVPLADIVLSQVRLESTNSRIQRSLVESEVFAHNLLMRSIRTGSGVNKALEVFEESVKKKLESEQVGDPSEIQKMAKDITEEHRVVYSLPSLASFLYYDPIEDLEKLKVPVLALFGGNDQQVTIEQNKDRMEGALIEAGVDYQAKTFEFANHLFQKSQTGLRNEYIKLEKRFVEGFEAEISKWILSLKPKSF